MAVNMPGSSNISKLWEVLEKGLNTLVEIPEHRFNIRDYEGTKNPNRQMKARTGNFIQGADEFDNRFFKISPREAKSMDPQQRVLLHTAYEALEDSGYVPGTTSSSQPDTFGCYIGAATHDYVQNLRGDIDVYYSTGTLCSYLSGRISYAMGWSGPSMVVDTACSSSLAAVYQGARALMNGDCKSALVGGVNVITSPDMFLGLDRGHFLSPTGQCRAFDAAADGYSRGEGCGLFVLKRLSDALAENDNIYGTIRGIEVNQSGLAHSITHPHAPTQVALFERVLRNAAIHPSRVNVVEAHGTGTQAGDINEIASIRQVFSANRTSQNPLHVTSIKGNIGHLEAASGAAGLAKLLLMLKHQTIPPQISFNKLNPSIEPLENDNTMILRRSGPWKPSYNGSSRMAFLNNFGAAGSNAALVLEEHIHSPSQAFDHPLVFVLSAKDEHALNKLRSDYIQWLQSPESKTVPMVDIAYSMTARRQLYSYRLAVVASERTRLVESLHKAAIVSSSAQPIRRVVFVFSGQSSQYPEMGQVFYSTSPLFKHHVDECHAILISLGFNGVLSIFTGNEVVLSDFEKIEAYQAAIFTLEYALGKLWMFWGIVPTAVIGHSLGEYTALVFAGVLTLRGALTLVAHRVRLMSRKCDLDSTGMLAINLSPDLVKHLLGTSENVFPLTVSCYNGPNDCVVSGPLEALEDFKSFLDATKGCRSKMLAVPYGYHSDFMTTISFELTSIAKGIEIRAPNLPVASNVDGNVVLPGEEGIFKPDYFARHCSQPVQFDGAITSSRFLKGLVFKENIPRILVIQITLGDGHGSFAISSRVEPLNELILHVRGDYLLQSISDCAAKLCQMLPSVTGCINRLKDPSTKAEVFLSRTTYEVVFPRVVHYAKEYHTIKSLFVSPTDLQGSASIRLPSGHYRGTFTAHPVFLDTLLQVPGFIANLQGLGNAPVLTIAPPSTTCVESEPSSPSTLVADDRLSDTVFSRADVYLDVRNVINAALGTTVAFGDETDLETVGLDSLASIEVLHALQTHYGHQVPNDFLRKYRTISAIQEYLGPSKFNLPHRRLFIPQSPPKEAVQARLIGILRLGTNPVRVQDCNKMNPPIFFIHDGSGLVNYYDKVESLHRDVWAIYNPKFLFALPWASLKDMAVAYAEYISALSTGTILLGGWSFGGVVAYEVALQLAKRGVNTKGIILIDAPNPIGHVPLSDALIKTIARYDRKNGPVEIGKLVRTQFAMNAQLLSAYDPHETGGVCPPLVFLRSELGYAAEGIQVADIPSWLVDRSDPSTTIAGWSELSSSVKVWDVPGHHFQAFDNANIASVSAKLLQACEYLETL
ncbi:polyketide synthase [Lentinula edodes]|uniref:Polyketide synthase n=1 Tax=Lentinula edodes TaxID=5353 RepID=A0A1Q3E8Y3_LENED|nr:polyketide synthase [Lentinula edodes]